MFKGIFSIFLVSTVGVMAQGQTSSSQAQVGQSTTKLKQSRLKDLRLNVFSWSYGPGIQDPSRRSPNINGQTENGLGRENAAWVLMNFNMPLASDWRLSVIPGFVTSATRENQPFRLMNTNLGLGKEVITRQNWNFFIRPELSLPTQESSINDGMEYGAQVLTAYSYRQIGSKFSFDPVVVPGTTVFRDGRNSTFVYANPVFNYHVSDTFRVVLLSEHFLGTSRGQKMDQFRRTDPDFVGVGFRKTWLFSGDRTLFVAPYLNFFSEQPSLENTHFAMWFGGRFF